MDITAEALQFYRRKWEMWLGLVLTTDHERELATTKIALIDAVLETRRERGDYGVLDQDQG